MSDDDHHLELIAKGTHEGHRRAVNDSGLMRLFSEALVKHGGEAARAALFRWIGSRILMLIVGGAFAAVVVYAVKSGWIK